MVPSFDTTGRFGAAAVVMQIVACALIASLAALLSYAAFEHSALLWTPIDGQITLLQPTRGGCVVSIRAPAGDTSQYSMAPHICHAALGTQVRKAPWTTDVRTDLGPYPQLTGIVSNIFGAVFIGTCAFISAFKGLGLLRFLRARGRESAAPDVQ